MLSINKPRTLISNINNLSGIKAVAVPKDIYNLIDTSIYYSKLTNGLFDISIAPLTNLWRIGFDNAHLPAPYLISRTISLIDYNNIKLDPDTQSVFLTQKDMALDLGSIAKGYACDEIVELLRNNNVERALVDIGGNVYVLGNNLNNEKWMVGLQDPFSQRGESFAKIALSNQAIVTSGIYERYLEIEGTRYHHLINPKTGYPFDNNLASVTIISNYSTDGDALSTAVFAKGLAAGLSFVEALNGVEAVFVTTDYQVFATSGLTDNLIITNTQFSKAI